MVLVLNIFLQRWHLWKCFLTSFKYTLPVFVFTSVLYGGLNQTAFLFLFREGVSWVLSNFRFLLKPLLFRAFHMKVLLYWIYLRWWIIARGVCSPLWVAAPKSLVDDLSWHLHKVDYHWVFYMETIFQWIDLKVTSKKSVVVKFVSIVIFSPSLWKIAIASFLQRSSLSSFAFSITDNPSSLYKF